MLLQKAGDDDALGKADVIIMAVGVDEDTVYSKSTSLQVCAITVPPFSHVVLHITFRQRSCGKVMFSQVSTGGMGRYITCIML